MQRTDGADPAGLADVKEAATDPGESDSRGSPVFPRVYVFRRIQSPMEQRRRPR